MDIFYYMGAMGLGLRKKIIFLVLTLAIVFQQDVEGVGTRGDLLSICEALGGKGLRIHVPKFIGSFQGVYIPGGVP